MENQKNQNIVVVGLLVIIAVLLGLNLLRGESGPTPTPAEVTKPIDPALKPEDDPYVGNQVKNTIRKRADQIQACYNEFIERKPEIFEGQITLDWRINPDGKVLSPEVVGAEFGDDALKTCLVKKVQEFEFPKPPGGVEKYIAHKFIFKKTE